MKIDRYADSDKRNKMMQKFFPSKPISSLIPVNTTSKKFLSNFTRMLVPSNKNSERALTTFSFDVFFFKRP